MQPNLLEHPAVKAWVKLQPECAEPESIEILGDKKKWIKLQSGCTEPESIEVLDRKKRAWIKFRSERVEPEIIKILEKKKFIYRLEGVGPEGSAVIAKQCRQDTGMIEHTIYKEILSRLPIPTLRYYGLIEEPKGGFYWLFIEDAGTEKCSFHSGKHGALAARWLGLMHTSAADVATTARLPDRGPAYYLEHLQLARDTIQRNMVHSTLSSDELAVLESIVSQFNVLESCWSKVEKLCDRMPQTLVHSDFTSKNIGIRNGQTGIALLPFDWEMAGRGVPAADLAYLEQVDLGIYWSVVQQSWPHLDVQDIQRMANLGRIFRGLATISWTSLDFEYSWDSWPPKYKSRKHEWVKRAVKHMGILEVGFADAVQALGLLGRISNEDREHTR